ncbi:PhzF family phenazine biosynthesis protein [Streptosporangium sp. NBC_01810]|uniref:PhzF family phenazine biosynthesis protein n=1 Tax=Streptosporangium sp. NBC_01810 TaxID=2975951 RepID=UPI002DD9508D|nr:PhzF family phenazine biosynthesis protein [Streptosporangium sp. NBC_01810]WSA23220.1 PhzF family phenazine biosynthesis protein [Streptosporangium sp. NBC_01810]
MTTAYGYKVVDVFTHEPFLGNPVAVVLNADDLTTEAMQDIANWTNLSETAFVLQPTTAEADYRLRIFTPRSELPFAGHPTLGSAHAVLETGLITPRREGRLTQECLIGRVELSVAEQDGNRYLAFALPPATIEPLPTPDSAELELILGGKTSTRCEPAIVNVGPRWVIADLSDAAAVLDLRPDLTRLAAFERRLGITGVTVFGARDHEDAAIEVRTFAPSCGVPEDPVCGSGNGSVAAFRWERGLLPPQGVEYVAHQGRRVGRDGLVRVSVDAHGGIRVGGECVTCVDGSLRA